MEDSTPTLTVNPTGSRTSAVALQGLVDLPALSAVAQSFATMHGVGLEILDAAGFAVAEVRHGSEALDHFASSFDKGVTSLKATQDALRTVSLEGGAGQVRCFTGVRYLVRPILHSGRTVGRVALGPYVPEELHGVPPALGALDSELDEAQAETLLSRIRRLTQLQALDLSAHLAVLASALTARPEPLVPGAVVTRASQAIGPLSHELRTPLTAIIGYADMLAEGLLGTLAPEQREAALTILERSEALLLTLNSLLDLAVTASGPVPVLREPTDLNELVTDAIEALAGVARRAQVAVRADVDPLLPLVALDRSRLKESLVQLLGNAIKFNHPGGLATIAVRRRAGPGPELFEIEVADSGIGVEASEIERIFEPFYQVDGSPTRSFPGVGLGLALVKAHAEAHGGKALVKSTPGKGSRFTMVLPLTLA